MYNEEQDIGEEQDIDEERATVTAMGTIYEDLDSEENFGNSNFLDLAAGSPNQQRRTMPLRKLSQGVENSRKSI